MNSIASTSLNTFSPEREGRRFDHFQTTKSRKPNLARLRAEIQPKPDQGTMFLLVQGKKRFNHTAHWLNDTHCTNYGLNLKGYQPLLTGTDHTNQSTQKNNLFPHWRGGAHGPHRALQGVTQGERSTEAPEGNPAPPTAPERNTLQKTNYILKFSRPKNSIFDLNFVALKSFVPALSRLDLSDCTCT